MSSIDYGIIGARMKMARKQSDIKPNNQSAVAEFLGISRRTLSRYERGELCPSAATLKDFCVYTGINPEWILFGFVTGRQARGKKP